MMTRIVAIVIAIAAGVLTVIAILYVDGCAKPTEVVQANAVSQTCKDRFHTAVLAATSCPALLVELKRIADSDPACVEAKQYAGFKCLPRDGGTDGAAR